MKMIIAYCIAAVLICFHPTDDYYCSRNGKYLGSDASITNDLRLVSEQTFYDAVRRYGSSQTDEASLMLNHHSQPISTDNVQIQNDLQKVRDLSMRGVEYQTYIILDLQNAKITSIMSNPGTNSGIYFEYFDAPALGTNMPVGRDNHRMTFTVILAAVHGHPDADIPFITTLPTMSPDYDAVVAHSRQVPIYGIDAMTNTGLPGSRGRIHRANPDGTIDNNVGWTKGNGRGSFDIGRDALERWGRSGRPRIE